MMRWHIFWRIFIPISIITLSISACYHIRKDLNHGSQAEVLFQWREGIENLATQIMDRIKGDSYYNNKGMIVSDFIDWKTKERLRLSKVIEDELKDAIINRDNNLSLITESDPTDADLYLSGSYRRDKQWLSIYARLMDIKRDTLIATGRVTIRDVETISRNKDLISIISKRDPDRINNYNLEIDSLFIAERDGHGLDIDIWTDKREYQTGEEITIYFKADRDAYISLFDIHPDGKFIILLPDMLHERYPQEFQRLFPLEEDSLVFIKGGERYSISGIIESGPSGIERLMVIAKGSDNLLWAIDFIYIIVSGNLKGRPSVRGHDTYDWPKPPRPPTTIVGTVGKERYKLFQEWGILH